MPGWRSRVHAPLIAASIQTLPMRTRLLGPRAPFQFGDYAFRLDCRRRSQRRNLPSLAGSSGAN
jgi:hypothetical protein